MTQMILLFQVYTGFLTAWMTEIVWNAFNKLEGRKDCIPPPKKKIWREREVIKDKSAVVQVDQKKYNLSNPNVKNYSVVCTLTIL